VPENVEKLQLNQRAGQASEGRGQRFESSRVRH
jgi:hypothetical protein